MRVIQTASLTPEAIEGMDWDTKQSVYNGLDTAVTMEIFQELRPMLDNVSGSTYVFSRALQGPVLEMSTTGIRVDQDRRAKVLIKFRQELAKLEERLDAIVDAVGVPGLNWRSPTQLGNLLHDVMGIPEIKKRRDNGTYGRTLDRDALEKLQKYFYAEPISMHVLALRDLGKKISFLETEIDSDGRYRSNYNIGGTNTGRLASAMSDYGTGSNAQNIDRSLRSIFVADPGWKFANLDLEQGDSRNVGAICWDTFAESHGERFAGSYLDACESGDLHTSVAKLVWPGLAWTGNLKQDKEVAEAIFYRQDSYRQMAKKGGHGTNYYGTDATMALHLKTPVNIIASFQKSYFSAFPVIGSYDRDRSKDNWHNRVAWQLANFGYITTRLGRRRKFWGRVGDDETLRGAIAFEPQSMTADEVDQGMLRIYRERDRPLFILAQVHDSVLVQYREADEEWIVPWLIATLRTPLVLAKGREFCVPTEAKVGWNWGDFNDDPKKGDLNPDGLIKWKGGDERKRTEYPRELSFRGLL